MSESRLSYSSANLLKSCSQRYVYYKVDQVDQDPDFNNDTKAFDVGKAFHHVLEHSNHEEININSLCEEAVGNYQLEHEEGLLVKAMVFKYLKLNKASGLKAVFCELGLTTDSFIGFIDAIMVDPEGIWWLVDLKTAARVSDDTYVRLHKDTQLNLYASFVDHIAETLELDPKKFGGIRYRVTTKSKAKPKATESDGAFIKRIYSTIKSYDFIVPAKLLKPKEFFKDHMKLHTKSMKLRSGKEKPMKNYAACFSYFRPCPYWSKCHGAMYTEGVETMECKQAEDYA